MIQFIVRKYQRSINLYYSKIKKKVEGKNPDFIILGTQKGVLLLYITTSAIILKYVLAQEEKFIFSIEIMKKEPIGIKIILIMKMKTY